MKLQQATQPVLPHQTREDKEQNAPIQASKELGVVLGNRGGNRAGSQVHNKLKWAERMLSRED